MVTKIKLRSGTMAEWTANDPILALGELGFEYDTQRFKIGDGTSAWSALPYNPSDVGSVDDIPVDGATTDPISSNWAYDHVNGADPHGIYVLEANLFDATVPVTQAFSDVAATGSATTAARRDHVHGMPSATPVTTTLTNVFQYPAPGTEWTPAITGATLGASQSAKKVWIPLHSAKIGGVITSYRLVGNIIEAAAVTLDCKLVSINKADPVTTTDITNGTMTQITADGVFDVEVNCDNTTFATDKMYALEITGTTGIGDSIVVMGAEVVGYTPL